MAPLVVIDRSGFWPASGRRRAGSAAGQLRDQHRQVGPHGRLAAGEADAVDVEALDEDAGEALDLLEREQVLAGQPLHALGRHAVGAAEVAAVGDRDPQVTDGPPEGVDEIVRVLVHAGSVRPAGADDDSTLTPSSVR